MNSWLENIKLNNGLYEIYHALDPGIADVVNLLRDNGINTFASCQGGEGHSFDKPTVRIIPKELDAMQPEMDFIKSILAQAGYLGFLLKACDGYGTDGILVDRFIELEFWMYQEMTKPVWLFWQKTEQVVSAENEKRERHSNGICEW